MDNKYLPTRKVGSSAIGGAVASVVIWIITTYTGAELSPEVAAAITTIVMALVAYLVPDHSTLDRRASSNAPF